MTDRDALAALAEILRKGALLRAETLSVADSETQARTILAAGWRAPVAEHEHQWSRGIWVCTEQGCCATATPFASDG